MSWFRRRSTESSARWPYTADHDRVVWLDDVPRCDEGAALPVVLASDFRVHLIYVTAEPSPDWVGRSVQVIRADSENLSISVVEFLQPYAHLFGPPNDEAIIGHPLADRGLHPCGTFTVEDSSWIRALERMNAVHPRHVPARFQRLTHYIFTFRDSTFECAANDLTVSRHRGSLREIVTAVAARID